MFASNPKFYGILISQIALWAVDKRKTGRLVRRKSNPTYSLPSSGRAQKRAPWFRHESRCSFRQKIFFLLFLTAYQDKKHFRRNNIIRIIVFIASSKPQLQGSVTAWLGRALEWHSRGQRFDPAYLHQKTYNASCGSFLLVRLQKTSQKSSSKIVPFAHYLHSAKDATIKSNESHALGRASNGSTEIF